MRATHPLALTALCLCGGVVPSLAQRGSVPPGAHNPLSMVDEIDRLQAFGPPPFPGGTDLTAPTTFNYLTFSLNVGDGWPENFMVVEPIPAPTQPVPLVVMFHKFGSTQLDMSKNTTFPQEGGRLGWYVVCPLAANTKHYGSMPSQVHTEAVLLDMLARYPLIDRNRIYGIGFSMGGGAAGNYAARHLDPAKPMFAAMVTMSGGYALKHTYYSDPPTRWIFDFWYGNGSVGSADPWQMARSSTVNFDPITLQVEAGEDLARNLTHVPLQLVRATDEMIGYLMTQSDVMASRMQSWGAQPGPTYNYQFVPFGMDAYDHRWSMLDAQWAFDWLGKHTLTLPTSASTLADHDGVYFHFFVEQDAPNAFTPFTWNIDPANNAMQLSATANLMRLTVDTLGAGLNPTLPLSVNLSTTDGIPDEVVFTSVLAPPTTVTRDGNTSVSWSHDATTHELTLIETDGLVHVWSIIP